MQLFSTGLEKLNIDGTPVLDEQGKPVLAYTNDEIMSFARVWTGFDYQQGRANVEETSWSGNRFDPMKVQPGKSLFVQFCSQMVYSLCLLASKPLLSIFSASINTRLER